MVFLVADNIIVSSGNSRYDSKVALETCTESNCGLFVQEFRQFVFKIDMQL